jgi:hypothetical protein
MVFRVRIKKHISWSSVGWVSLIIIVVGFGVYVYLGEAGKIGKAKWLGGIEGIVKTQKMVSSSTSTEKNEKEKNLSVATEIEKGKEKIVVNQEPLSLPNKETKMVYEETAGAGEGITHLARKALKEYLSQKEVDFEITPEHKIYIEDYIQNRIGDRWLALGEKISISKDLIEEAINHSKELTKQELENLTQYASLVPSLSY